jgi:hypothetical protein
MKSIMACSSSVVNCAALLTPGLLARTMREDGLGGQVKQKDTFQERWCKNEQ